MKTLIIYHSQNGTTKKYAEKIGRYIETFNGKATVKSIKEATAEDVQSSDLLILGCWTSGMFLFGQKPDKEWVEFANNLPSIEGKETVLFTTFKIATGSMFRNMKKHLEPKGYKILGSMKSRNGKMDYYSFVALKFAYNYHTYTNIRISKRTEEEVLEVVPVF
jgi:flavodoxin